MNKTKIEWCDMSWNPVTGCLHGCPYCYARRIAKRFGTPYNGTTLHVIKAGTPKRYEECVRTGPYPYEFAPTLRLDRLGEPKRKTKGRTIFVCSMADLFGDWVPDDWIERVFEACKKAPQHKYLFLTKNPKRYMQLAEKNMLPGDDNFWYGTSTPAPDTEFFWHNQLKTFVSIEPILEPWPDVTQEEMTKKVDWVIIGAETGNRKERVAPERDWVKNIVDNCQTLGIPVFMKDSMKPVWGEDILTEYPWGKFF